MNSSLAKALYAALFLLFLPVLLLGWARHTAVPLPSIHSLPWGACTAALGIVLILLGMSALWFQGGGLPMNAFPPPRYVSGGIYRLISHPIYVGFALLCAGAAIAAGSSSGLWLVTPVVTLCSAALVLGYEFPDMQARFGREFPGPRLLPPDDRVAPSLTERVRCYLTVVLPWLVLYEAFVALGIPRDARIAYFPFEYRWPVWQWTEIFYASTYVVVGLLPWIVRTRHELRSFSKRVLFSMLIVFPLYFVLPLIAPPRPFAPAGFLGRLLILDRSADTAAAAFPSYHVILVFLAAEALGHTRPTRLLWRAWALLVSVSCVTTGMHALVDVVAGGLVTLVVVRMDRLWSFVRTASEKIANSWKEWHLGPLRVINHGAYAAVGVLIGMAIIEIVLGAANEMSGMPRPSSAWAGNLASWSSAGTIVPLAIFLGGAVGSALWAQLIEGSPALLRPLGFYGGMIGTIVGGITAAWLTRTSLWIVLTALVLAAPWIQGIGRLRCLVQGCCHGRPAPEGVGIRYTHPRSRVTRIEALRGVPIYPTPLYSLLWNAIVALVVTRFYLLQAGASMVCGVYLILSSAGRFVEEAYRGEPQTPMFGRLRLYQWIAVVLLVIGAWITTLPSPPATGRFSFRVEGILPALVCALAAWIVTGVDFPQSNRRFARLA